MYGNCCLFNEQVQVFELSLFDVEKDEVHCKVPKIVVECVRFIERHENIRECGIYRDSSSKRVKTLRHCVKGL